MKIIVAPDSFKGSISSINACQAITRGIQRVMPEAYIIQIPMADGGEGTVEALVNATKGEYRKIKVCGPLSDKVDAQYGILTKNGNMAVIEIAQAAGLPLVPEHKRNPLNTTTYGLGEIILDAVSIGLKRFIIGLGGSATNDCGCGMAQSLGVVFQDHEWKPIHSLMNGRTMGNVSLVDASGLNHGLKQCEFIVACDVKNPLLGSNGATYTYGPQKGASDADLTELEANMSHVIGHIEHATQRQVRDIEGAGAAGGLGAGLMAFLDAKLKRGIDIVLEHSGFEEKIKDADLVITGEGKVDHTTVQGKTLSGIAACAKQHHVPVIALAGSVGSGTEDLYDIGINAVLPICNEPMALETAMANAEELIEAASMRALQILKSVINSA